MSLTRKQYLAILLVILVWAGNVIAIKIAVTELPPMTAATLRFFFAGLLFLPLMKKVDKTTLKGILQVSLLMNVLHIGTLFIALRMLDAASVSVLLQTQVVFATLLGAFFFKESIRWRTWTGIGLALVGLVVMLGEPDLAGNPAGVALMLFSTFALALSYVKMKHLKQVPPATYISLMSLFAVPFVFAGSLVLSPESWAALPDANWGRLVPVFLFQCVLVSLTHIYWQRLMHMGDVGKITAFTLLIPFFAIMLSVLLLDEHITWLMIAGGLITMLGVGIITLRRIQKKIA
jgi:O-acetylserine/cysteine efflux transporter